MKLKVRTSLTHSLHPMLLAPEGIKFSAPFIDRLYEKEEYFRERIILKINETAGDNWSVHFGETPALQPTFYVDIRAEDKHLRSIISVISEAFPELNLHFWKPDPYVLLWKRQKMIA